MPYTPATKKPHDGIALTHSSLINQKIVNLKFDPLKGDTFDATNETSVENWKEFVASAKSAGGCTVTVEWTGAVGTLNTNAELVITYHTQTFLTVGAILDNILPFSGDLGQGLTTEYHFLFTGKPVFGSVS